MKTTFITFSLLLFTSFGFAQQKLWFKTDTIKITKPHFNLSIPSSSFYASKSKPLITTQLDTKSKLAYNMPIIKPKGDFIIPNYFIDDKIKRSLIVVKPE